MSTYVIGDVHGCYAELQQLLSVINFRPDVDRLWFLGDLVNRGPSSLEVLRFVKGLGDSAKTVLGNHDLHLLAVASGIKTTGRRDLFGDLMLAEDLDLLVGWLRHCPLILDAPEFNAVLVHAGLPPQWSLAKCLARAAEVEAALRCDDWQEFLAGMYGNNPRKWHSDMVGVERWRTITNYFTRMRHCKKGGRLEFRHISRTAPEGYQPWYQYEVDRKGRQVLFGHWAALMGETGRSDCLALDYGCVWGGHLCALRLEDRKAFKVAGKPYV